MTTINNHLPQTPHPAPNPIPSSSPAFATPAHPIRPYPAPPRPNPITNVPDRAVSVLPILLPPHTLRPIAFRTFTKKHNLTLTSTALQALATFIGRHCGASWREEGLAELVLEDIARSWKRIEGRVIVDTHGDGLKNILKQLEGSMAGGRIVAVKGGRSLSRQNSLGGGAMAGILQRQDSFGMSRLGVEDDEDEHEERDPRAWLKVVDAFSQPRLLYNPSKKHFEKAKAAPTFFPPPSSKTTLFRNRYHLIHQRILRHASFQTPSITSSGTASPWRITPIANLLGRSGSGHLLLGLLTIAPAGTLALSDLTGSIHLDLSQAAPLDTVETYLTPGMIVLVDGVYEEEYNPTGGTLGNTSGVGGTIGGRFIGFSIGAPRCETRAATLGLAEGGGLGVESETAASAMNVAGTFGWTDFLGVGSEKAVGARMRRIEQRLLRNAPAEDRVNSDKVVVVGHCTLDSPRTLAALRAIFSSYTNAAPEGLGARGRRKAAAAAAAAAADGDVESESAPVKPPLAFVLLGPFTTHPSMSLSSATLTPASTSTSTSSSSAPIPDSITTKESFDALASLLSDFPTLLTHTTFVFVPGDGDPWASAFSAGAAAPVPRHGVPDMFTSRIRRVFANANAVAGAGAGPGAGAEGGGSGRVKGEAIWTTNPSRLTLFGSSCEMVLFRDDVSGRLRRSHIPLRTRADAADGEEAAEDVAQPRDAASGMVHADGMEVDFSPHATPAPTQRQRRDKTSPTTPSQRLTKTLLDQGHLSPFPLSTRPQNWDYAGALSLYPLPSVLVLCDSEMEAFACGYQGVVVVNAGRVVGARGEGVGARWCEFDVGGRRGIVRGL